MPKFDTASYQHGRNLYDAGATLGAVALEADRIDSESRKAHEAAQTPDEHELIAARIPSMILGFGDGLLVDIRRLAGRGGQRA